MERLLGAASPFSLASFACCGSSLSTLSSPSSPPHAIQPFVGCQLRVVSWISLGMAICKRINDPLIHMSEGIGSFLIFLLKYTSMVASLRTWTHVDSSVIFESTLGAQKVIEFVVCELRIEKSECDVMPNNLHAPIIHYSTCQLLIFFIRANLQHIIHALVIQVILIVCRHMLSFVGMMMHLELPIRIIYYAWL